MRYRALIVDDERLAREKIRHLIEREKDFAVVGESTTSDDALAAIERQRPDIVFLDIQMPGGNGFDLVRRLPAPLPQIVFVTAHADYAVDAFEVEAFDYLLKPFDRGRFRKTLDRVRARTAAREEPLRERLDRLLTALERPARYLARIAVAGEGRTRFIEADSIEWIESEDNYVRIHAAGAEHLVRDTLSRLHASLDPSRFVRVHRSALVNAAAVREVKTLFHGDLEIVLKGGGRVRVGRSYRHDLKRRLGGG